MPYTFFGYCGTTLMPAHLFSASWAAGLSGLTPSRSGDVVVVAAEGAARADESSVAMSNAIFVPPCSGVYHRYLPTHWHMPHMHMSVLCSPFPCGCIGLAQSKAIRLKSEKRLKQIHCFEPKKKVCCPPPPLPPW